MPFLLEASSRGHKSTNFYLLEADCPGLICQPILEYMDIRQDPKRRCQQSPMVVPTKSHGGANKVP